MIVLALFGFCDAMAYTQISRGKVEAPTEAVQRFKSEAPGEEADALFVSVDAAARPDMGQALSELEATIDRTAVEQELRAAQAEAVAANAKVAVLQRTLHAAQAEAVASLLDKDFAAVQDPVWGYMGTATDGDVQKNVVIMADYRDLRKIQDAVASAALTEGVRHALNPPDAFHGFYGEEGSGAVQIIQGIFKGDSSKCTSACSGHGGSCPMQGVCETTKETMPSGKEIILDAVCVCKPRLSDRNPGLNAACKEVKAVTPVTHEGKEIRCLVSDELEA